MLWYTILVVVLHFVLLLSLLLFRHHAVRQRHGGHAPGLRDGHPVVRVVQQVGRNLRALAAARLGGDEQDPVGGIVLDRVQYLALVGVHREMLVMCLGQIGWSVFVVWRMKDATG